jgi:hypothetical protein
VATTAHGFVAAHVLDGLAEATRKEAMTVCIIGIFFLTCCNAHAVVLVYLIFLDS